MDNNINQSLHAALKNNEMYLVYQPIVDENEFIIGYEVLTRWKKDHLVQVEPKDFMAAFEQGGLISDLNNWFFNYLLSDIKKAAVLKVRTLFINISLKQLSDPSLMEHIKKLTKYIDLKNIVFEVTEATLMYEIETTLALMRELAEDGASFALDDFGTGYSSMKYLKIMPLKFIKIGREFVREIDFNHSDMAIVKASLEMSKAMGFEVIATGVESRPQFVILKSLGVKYAQGFFFEHPETPADLMYS